MHEILWKSAKSSWENHTLFYLKSDQHGQPQMKFIVRDGLKYNILELETINKIIVYYEKIAVIYC